MKKALALALAAMIALVGCSGPSSSGSQSQGAASSNQSSAAASSSSQESEPAEVIVFAAASMKETLDRVAEAYKTEAPHVTLVLTLDSSGTLKTQIQEGAACDIFISAAQKQMNQLDSADTSGQNTEGLDFVLQGSRVNLLENKVVLIVPADTPADIQSFQDIATDKLTLIALGNADVPVGQYAQEIFTNMGMWDDLNTQQKITFGSNVKEVTAQVAEAAVDCGIVYGTDAYSAKLEVVAEAPAGTYSPAIYPAAILNITQNQTEAEAFLAYLQTDACSAIFEEVGFSIAK